MEKTDLKKEQGKNLLQPFDSVSMSFNSTVVWIHSSAFNSQTKTQWWKRYYKKNIHQTKDKFTIRHVIMNG
jgi:hypothetical protein